MRFRFAHGDDTPKIGNASSIWARRRKIQELGNAWKIDGWISFDIIYFGVMVFKTGIEHVVA